MNAKSLIVIALATLLLSPLAPAQTAEPPPQQDNGMDTQMGTIRMPLYPVAEGGRTEVITDVTLKETANLDSSMLVMFGLSAESDRVRIEYEGVRRSDGSFLPVIRDERNNAQEPKVFIEPKHVPVGERLQMVARYALEGNGRFPIAAVVIAFSPNWGKVRLDDGSEAQLVSWGMLKSTGVRTSPWDPPFEGRGNIIPEELFYGLVAAGAVGLFLFNVRSRLPKRLRGKMRRDGSQAQAAPAGPDDEGG